MHIYVQHIESMLTLLWRQHGDTFKDARVAILDTWFTAMVSTEFIRYEKAKKKSTFAWNSLIKNYLRGVVPSRSTKLGWYTNVDIVYVPMNWGKRHWVAVVIDLKKREMIILDPFIVNNDKKRLPRLMRPLTELLPIIIREFIKPDEIQGTFPKKFTYVRDENVYQNERSGDCGPLAVKFIELHAQGLPLDGITDKMVDEMRMKFAVDIYEEFVMSLRV